MQDGKLGISEFSARLRRVFFGTFDNQPACLIVFRISFATAKKGWFRCCNASVEAEFERANSNGWVVASDDDNDVQSRQRRR